MGTLSGHRHDIVYKDKDEDVTAWEVVRIYVSLLKGTPADILCIQ